MKTAFKPDPRLVYKDQAAALNQACKDGKLIEAYRVLNKLKGQQRQDLMLVAGFSVTRADDPKQLALFQGQLAAACRNRCDGRSLHLVQLPERFKPMAIEA